MNDTLELTLNIKHALIVVFAIGFLVGGTGTMLTLNFTGTPVGAITAGTQDSGDSGGSAPSDTGSQNQQADNGNNGGNTVSVSNINTDNEPTLGSSDAPVTIVEFSDYQCPFCRKFALGTFNKIKQNYVNNDKVRFVYKDFPLTQLGHNQAPRMARATQCAGDQGKYWEMHDKLFDEQQKLSPRGTAKFSADKIPQWASDLGLNMDTFQQCMNSDKYKSEVQNDLKEGKNLGVSGTPTFFIYANGDDTATKLVGAQPYSRFQSVIDQKLNSDGDSGSQQDLKTWGTSKDNPRVIEVTAEQYQFNPSTITAKQGEWIQLKATSKDVEHGISIRPYGVNFRIQPGETAQSKPFRVTDTGTFTMACSVFCGSGHSSMRGTLKVTAP